MVSGPNNLGVKRIFSQNAIFFVKCSDFKGLRNVGMLHPMIIFEFSCCICESKGVYNSSHNQHLSDEREGKAIAAL